MHLGHIVGADDKILSAAIALSFSLGGIVYRVIGGAAAGANSSATHTSDDGFIGDVDVDHLVDSHAQALESLCLSYRSGKTVENKAVFAIILSDSGLHQVDNNFIGNKCSLIDEAFCFDSNGSFRLDSRSQDLTG